MVTQIFKNLFRRKTRTLLTVSGIAVGVAMIVALGAMGEGLRTGYVSMFSGSGADLIMMQKGSYDITSSRVDQEVMDQVATLPGVRAVNGIVVGNVTAPGAARRSKAGAMASACSTSGDSLTTRRRGWITFDG